MQTIVNFAMASKWMGIGIMSTHDVSSSGSLLSTFSPRKVKDTLPLFHQFINSAFSLTQEERKGRTARGLYDGPSQLPVHSILASMGETAGRGVWVHVWSDSESIQLCWNPLAHVHCLVFVFECSIDPF